MLHSSRIKSSHSLLSRGLGDGFSWQICPVKHHDGPNAISPEHSYPRQAVVFWSVKNSERKIQQI